jgi:glycosyltransferase involved in cell wall biosynthesis
LLRLLHIFSTFAIGGPQVRFAAICRGLGRAFEHLVVTMDGNRDAIRLIDRSVHLRLRPIVWRKGGALNAANLRAARAVLAEERPDLLVTYNWGAIEWALADRLRPVCPHLHVVDGFGAEEATRQLPRRVWLRRVALTGHTGVVVPSHALYAIATTAWRLRPTRVHLIPNGVDATPLMAQARRPLALRRVPDERLFGTLAGLRPEKNLGRLLRIAARLPKAQKWRVIVAGDGPERAALARQAQELGLAERVVLTGFVDRPGALLGALDVFALTSDTEQMPLSALEAMAVGLPVLATDVGDLRRMLPKGCAEACLLGRDQEAAFARQLEALLGSPAECRRLGELNRARAADFDVETMVASYARLLRTMIA